MTASSALAGVLSERAFTEPASDKRWVTLGGLPEAVVSPESTEEVSAVMSWAGGEGVGVVPAGSGRRLGPRTMAGRFIVLASDRLTGMEIYEPADVTFTAKAGTPMRDLARDLHANGQRLPLDPPDVLGRTLGGLVASGETGPLWMGYGDIRNHVLGVTVVTGDGRVLKLGGRVVKNVAGFDLVKPMVGSRGSLAVITSVCMRAFPEPAVDRSLILRAGEVGELVSTALAIGTAPVMPVSSVLRSGDLALGGGAALVVRLHGAEATVGADQRALEAHAGVTFEVGGDEEGPGGTVRSDDTSRGRGADAATVLRVSVLPSRLREAVAALGSLGVAHVAIDSYAARLRIGSPGFERERIHDLGRLIEGLGGALSIERAPVGADVAGLASEPSPEEVELASRLRTVFDPKGTLWRRRT